MAYLDDRSLLLISLFLGLSGFIGMIISADTVTPPEVSVSSINHGMVDRKVTVEGTVEDFRESEHSGTLFLVINDGSGVITAVIFESTSAEIKKNGLDPHLLRGMKVRVTGKVNEYKGSLEIIVEEPSNLRTLAC
ncbi:conserved hypothetical protein [Methanothermobacter sp. CaT2]|uniref:OB domain-containing protein n=1 Tax=Methanothermobacter defluvii TaxID=49339 RepID=A0A371NBF1_9EURY|nr:MULTISPECIES: exodeoxyribonuclease VII large subunit [Methanothermobacter]NLU04748.1 exodeoxyribonuclease VII large subunit [Methanothermobacter sp.]REE26363.1 hypothetical protein C7452_1325 [Methanothermobacter defluvii]WBF07867.1 exodeoxyribonuclease VII large subunit [Methanothermobacter thermautotrophicus]BAM70689.1 conserved hypothetical protein [Methanothermobacter sp. CaT2]